MVEEVKRARVEVARRGSSTIGRHHNRSNNNGNSE